MVNINSNTYAIWRYFLALYLFRNGYLFYLLFVVKITLFNTVQM